MGTPTGCRRRELDQTVRTAIAKVCKGTGKGKITDALSYNRLTLDAVGTPTGFTHQYDTQDRHRRVRSLRLGRGRSDELSYPFALDAVLGLLQQSDQSAHDRGGLGKGHRAACTLGSMEPFGKLVLSMYL